MPGLDNTMGRGGAIPPPPGAAPGQPAAPRGAGAIPPPPGMQIPGQGAAPGTGAHSAPRYEPGAEPAIEDFFEGVLTETMKTLRMPLDLAGVESEWVDSKIDDWDADSKQSGWGTAGGYASYALPGLGAMKGYGMLQKALLSKFGKVGKGGLKKVMKSISEEVTEGSPGVGGRAPRGRRS